MSEYVEIVNIPCWELEVDISIKAMIEFDSVFLGSFGVSCSCFEHGVEASENGTIDYFKFHWVTVIGYELIWNNDIMDYEMNLIVCSWGREYRIDSDEIFSNDRDIIFIFFD